MSLFVYITKECEESAISHGLQEELSRFQSRVENAQDVRLFDPFPPPYFVKKKFGGRQGRLIAALEPEVSGHSVVVFLAVMVRGQAAYEDHFSTDPVGYGERHFQHLYNQAELERFVNQRTAVEPPRDKAIPNTAEYGYLHQVFTGQEQAQQEDLICESIDWVNKVTETPFKNRLESLFEALSNAAGDSAIGGRNQLGAAGAGGVGILTRTFPEHRLRFVATATQGGGAVDTSTLSEPVREVLEHPSPTREMVLQASRRAYPSILLADLDLWSELQKDRHANLALSPEETKLLSLAKRPAGGFPLFINGRAGSGKTTLLQYLFADFLYYHLTCEEKAGGPVYFTCSAELLSQSRTMVTRLLRCNSQWWHQQDREKLITDNSGEIDGSFKEFHAYLYSLLTPREQAEQFTREKYVSYSTFKRLWHARFSKEPAALKNHGPDISWHVIRSYIKGLTADDLTDPDEYLQLDQKQITVTQKTYEVVFDKVWTRWFKKLGEDQGYWDDQDLARHLIENDRMRPRYTAVFCDEAQDFTRIELELLLRSSIYSDRKIDPLDIARVPFVFAGDQLQTLNPTGFRWDAIKASFVEKFILALDPARRSRLTDLNYQELMLNYRSSRTIVRFSNFVQALRARLFDLGGLQPQIPWDRDKGVPGVVGVNRDNAEFWNQLKREREIAIIVPCGEGEELDFIREDPILSAKIKIEEKVPDALVLSPARAKGLEFNRVVVYGFGEAPESTGELLSPLQGEADYASDPDKTLPFQYFINRLYVAVSRPKRRLFVVDSEKSFEKFWAFAHDDRFESAILKGIRNGDSLWRPHVGRLEFGAVEDLSADRQEDPRRQADALARQGRANSDPYMMRQAAASYRNLNDALEADRCKAEALCFEQNFLEAGKTFLRCNATKEAVTAFWRAGREGGWAAIVDAADNRPEINVGLEFAFSQIITRPSPVSNGITAFERLLDALTNTEQLPLIAGNPAWPSAIRATLDKFSSLKAEAGEWSLLSLILDRISALTGIITPSARAWIHFRAGNMQPAAELWEQCKETTGKDYKTAKAYASPFPEKLLHLVELEKYSDAVQQCSKNADTPIPATFIHAAVRAHLHQGLLLKALHYAGQSKSIELIWEVLNSADRNNDVLTKGWGLLFALAAEKMEINLFLSFAERGLYGGMRANPKLTAWVEAHRPAVNHAWLRGVARTKAISELTWDDRKTRLNQRPMAEFLRKTFLANSRPNVPERLLKELGAAVEILGNRADALLFYEWARAAGNEKHLPANYSIERWVVCKERQAHFEDSKGETQVARQHRAEALEVRNAQGTDFAKSIFPEFPELTSIQSLIEELLNPPSNPAAQAPDIETREKAGPIDVAPPNNSAKPKFSAKVEVEIGEFSVELLRPQQKLIVKHKLDGAIASFKLESKTGSAIDVDIGPSKPESARWAIKDWAMEINLSDPSKAVINFDASGTSLAMNI